jgi:hypothetical protein
MYIYLIPLQLLSCSSSSSTNCSNNEESINEIKILLNSVLKCNKKEEQFIWPVWLCFMRITNKAKGLFPIWSSIQDRIRI